MIHLRTMIWKELREILQSGNRNALLGTMAITLVLLGVIWPLQSHATWFDGGALVIWTVAPLLQLPQLIADAFAGERERHTLETLLASSLPGRAILLGKILAPTLWAWLFVQGAMLVALIPVNLANQQLRFYPLVLLIAGMALSLLASFMIASAGVLISLRASSVRQAQQWMGILMLSFFFLPMALVYVVSSLPASIQDRLTVFLERGDFSPLVLMMMVLMLVLGGLLFLAADLRFRRSRLLLD